MTLGGTMGDDRPGLATARLGRLVTEAVERCGLDLSGVQVLTEAATGPYVVTPVIAALSGADVVAVTRASRYGSVDEVTEVTMRLATSLGVADRITVTTERTAQRFAWADVITNSGHLRPITGELAAAISADAVLSLMFESWEIQAGRLDIDLDTLIERGVRIAGTNERHPDVDVFSYLGPMAVAGLADAGVSAYHGRVAVLCDNPFRDYVVRGLVAAGAEVDVAASLDELTAAARPEALLVSLTPTGTAALTGADLEWIRDHWPDTVVVQFWGDIDRAQCDAAGISYWPPTSPGAGHMGVLPSRVGPEPIVRLQAGGLKVAQVLRLSASDRTAADLEYLDVI